MPEYAIVTNTYESKYPIGIQWVNYITLAIVPFLGLLLPLLPVAFCGKAAQRQVLWQLGLSIGFDVRTQYRCYDALKYEVYPDIIYKFKSITNIKSQGDNTYKANLEGTLDIAGVLKTIKIDVEIEKKGSIISIKGAKPVKMSDFDVIPPKALLGTLKTGNEITIIFNLNFVE